MTYRIVTACALAGCLSTAPIPRTGAALAIIDTDNVTNWYAAQGERPIHDEDLFRITGDTAALAATEDMRRHGRIWQWVGVVAVAAGLLIASGGAAVGATSQTEETYLLGGITAVGLGSWSFGYGTSRRRLTTHAVDRTTAKHDVDGYNTDLRHAAGTDR